MFYRRSLPLVFMLALITLSVPRIAAHTVSQVPSNHRILLPMVVSRGADTGNIVRTGEATYYNEADGGGNCMFDPSPEDLMVGAMNHVDYANAALCGAYVEIAGPRGIVTVRIVDQCPECPVGNIDLSPDAFPRIADLAAGRVPITWRVVSPDISGPIRYRFKEGSSQWWTAVQVRNHRNPITKLEYRDPSGSFVVIPRMEYNYFVAASGMGPGPYEFRVTDSYGNTLIDSGIALQEGAEVSGNGQFPVGP